MRSPSAKEKCFSVLSDSFRLGYAALLNACHYWEPVASMLRLSGTRTGNMPMALRSMDLIPRGGILAAALGALAGLAISAAIITKGILDGPSRGSHFKMAPEAKQLLLSQLSTAAADSVTERRFADAQEIYARIIGIEDSDASRISRADVAIRRGDFRTALDDCDTVLTRAPRETQALILRGKSFALAGDYPAAERDLLKAITITPNNRSAYIELGRVYDGMGAMDKAAASLDKAILIPGNDANSLAGRASAYAAKRELVPAKQLIDRALELRNDSSFLEIRAEIEKSQGDWLAAATDLASLTVKYPHDPSLWIRRIEYLLHASAVDRQHLETAARVANDALEFNSRNADLLDLRAKISGAGGARFGDMQLMQRNSALADATDALLVDPSRLERYRERGLILVQLGRWQEALEDLKKYLASKADDAAAHNGAATASIMLGNIEQAKNHCKMSLKAAPQSAYLATCIVAHVRAGEYPTARTYSEQFTKIQPDTADALYLASFVHEGLNDRNRAKNERNRALNKDPQVGERYSALLASKSSAPPPPSVRAFEPASRVRTPLPRGAITVPEVPMNADH